MSDNLVGPPSGGDGGGGVLEEAVAFGKRLWTNANVVWEWCCDGVDWLASSCLCRPICNLLSDAWSRVNQAADVLGCGCLCWFCERAPRLYRFNLASEWGAVAAEDNGLSKKLAMPRGLWMYDAMRKRFRIRHGDVVAVNEIPCAGWFIAYQASEVDRRIDFYQNTEAALWLKVPLEVTSRRPYIVEEYRRLFENLWDEMPRLEKIDFYMFSDHPFLRRHWGAERYREIADAAALPSPVGLPQCYIVRLTAATETGPYAVRVRPAVARWQVRSQ